MTPFKQRLKIVWNNRPPKRYLPRSLNGGTGWGVFDVKKKEVLSDAEVKKITTDTLLTETVTN